MFSVEFHDFRSVLLVWDGTVPTCDLGRQYVSAIVSSSRAKHNTLLMAQLGGKLSSPHICCILVRGTSSIIEQSFLRPGDLACLTVSVETPINGPGVYLVADQCQFGMLADGSSVHQQLTSRLANCTDALQPCVAACISSDAVPVGTVTNATPSLPSRDNSGICRSSGRSRISGRCCGSSRPTGRPPTACTSSGSRRGS